MAVGDWSTVYINKYFHHGESNLGVEINLRDYSDGLNWRNPKFFYCIKSVTFGTGLKCNIIPEHQLADTYKFVDTTGDAQEAIISWVAVEAD